MNYLLKEGIVDTFIAIRIIKLFITPFNKTPAYKLGVIDDKGKNLIPVNKLKTAEQKNSYGMLERFIFNLKRILNKVPGGDNYIKNSIAALLLLREQGLETDTVNETKLKIIMEYLNSGVIFTEEQLFIEDTMASGVGSFQVGQPSVSGGLTGNIDASGPINNTSGSAGNAGIPINVGVLKRKSKQKAKDLISKTIEDNIEKV